MTDRGSEERVARTENVVLGESLDQLVVRLGTSRSGLTTAEAKRRLEERGRNDLGASRWRSKVVALLRDTFNPLVLILLLAAVASAFLGDKAGAIVIAAIVLVSASIGFWQKYRSDRAVKQLQAHVAPTATVRRDGAWTEIPRRDVVTGDLVRLAAGDLVPADVRLITSTDLHVEQAALTGESLPAEKVANAGALEALGPECSALLFLGTSVVSGSAEAVVFAAGGRTAFGDVVARLAERPEETEFERGIRRFGTFILQTVLFLVLFILVVNVGLGRDAFQSLLFAIALAVGLTPEFLPMITTVTLARGAVRMAREHVIVKHLSAIQNLGSVDVLCSDKTGTLTAGTMSVDASLDPFGAPSDVALQLAVVNSRHQAGIKSPLDAAILASPVPPAADVVKVAEIPFDFERRMLSVVVSQRGTLSLVTKGAPESVFERCSAYERNGEVKPFDEAARASSLEAYRAASSKGFRVLALARRPASASAAFTPHDETDLTLVGFVTFADHLLEGVADSIARLRKDGVKTKILTGDNELVSAHICALAGIDVREIVLGREISGMSETALAILAERASLFARLSPAQKHRIIRALKSRGHVVGYLGDGINDAPSLHAADVGISVAGAVDIAREASDIILLERRLSVLHAGILAGRESFGNVFKYLLMGTSSNFGNMFSMAGAAVFLPFLPMLPTQILLNNFLYDVAQITIPTDRVDALFRKRPHRWDIGVIRRFMLVIGPVSSLFDFVTFFFLLRVFRLDEAGFHSGWFVESLASQILVLFVIRTLRRPWKSRPSGALVATALLAVAVGIVLPWSPLGPLLGFVPLPAAYFAFLLAVLVAYLAMVEVLKHRVLKRLLHGLADSVTPFPVQDGPFHEVHGGK